MGDASFRRRAEMLSRPLASLLGIFYIKLKTSWYDTSANGSTKLSEGFVGGGDRGRLEVQN